MGSHSVIAFDNLSIEYIWKHGARRRYLIVWLVQQTSTGDSIDAAVWYVPPEEKKKAMSLVLRNASFSRKRTDPAAYLARTPWELHTLNPSSNW